jgi:transketolase
VRELVGEKLAVYNISSPLAPDKEAILNLAKAGIIFVYEDHNTCSGLKATIADIVASAGLACKVVGFGVEGYPLSGTPDDVFSILGLSPEAVAERINNE